ncbi:MAG TPA: elongation factor P-like protein YeiP [Gammaproteobacteria bacterium]|nr:elongation factor P-like protein YeiP [Gammaproteobacteria bacterium]
MPKASELKRGSVVEINGAPYVVKTIESRSPSSRGAQTIYKIRFKNAQTGQKLDESCKADDTFTEMDLIKRQAQFLYQDGDMFTFMDIEDYSQYTLGKEDLEEEIGYLVDGMEGIYVLLVDDRVLGIELPQTVSLEIRDTAPALKGATATGRTKPATLVTGLEVQVPEYIETGEVIKINTDGNKFMSRA